MESGAAMTVTESATQIVLAPAGAATGPGLVFQPGAKVEARAYAAVLHPLAEAGTLVVVPKQPLGIAFLATGAFEASRSDLPPCAAFTAIDGASHASFGDYGPQPGDGTPSLPADDAREQITRAGLEFLTSLPR